MGESAAATTTGQTIEATVTTNVGGSTNTGGDTTDAGIEHEPAKTPPPEIGGLFAWDDEEWTTTPSKRKVPGPLTMRVDAWAKQLERVEFSVDKELPFAVAQPSDGSYFATVVLDHAMWEGERTFTARAFDTAGRSAETTLDLKVDFLYPSGYAQSLTYAKSIDGHAVWSGTATTADGSFWVVGYEEKDGDIPRLLVEHRAPDGDVIAADFDSPAYGQPTYGRRVVERDGAIYVLASLPNKDVVARYQADGTIVATWAPSSVELHDVVATGDHVVVVGNTGELGQTSTLLSSWWLSNALAPQWEDHVEGDGDQKNSARRAKMIGSDLIIVGFVELFDERAGYIGAHDPATGERWWSATLYNDAEEEDIVDVAGTPDAIITIGTATTAEGTRPRLRKIGWGEPVTHDIDNLVHTDSFGLMIASAPGYEFVIGARTCTNEPKCGAVFRRYGWGTPYPKLIWHDQTDGGAAMTPTALATAQWGFTHGIYVSSVSFGQGHHLQSSLMRFHP